MSSPDYRIYYDGGNTYDGPPENAPFFGVLAIVQKDKNHGRRILSVYDYYVWTGSEWLGVDRIGLIDYLQQPGWKRFLTGRMVEREYFYSVVAKANDDPDFPVRTAKYRDEIIGE